MLDGRDLSFYQRNRRKEKTKMKLLKLLQGKKTYIVAVITAVLNLLVAFGVFSAEQISTINYILIALGLGAIRNGIKNGGELEWKN